MICTLLSWSFLLPQAALPRTEWRPVALLRNRNNPALAYDPSRKRLVLYGGGAGSSFAPNDTWEWDGRTWHLMRPRNRPFPYRIVPRMAYDPVRRTVILFGGYVPITKTLYNDTWEWDGRDWKKLSPKNRPAPRYHFDMATDPVRRRIVLFGGYKGPRTWFGNVLLDDTWEWDGSDWIRMQPRSKPRARGAPGLAFHARSGRIVLWGGVESTGYPIDPEHTYLWDGKDWTQLRPKTSPPGGGGRLSSDPFGGDVLCLYNDQIGRKTDKLYRWDGVDWSLLSTLPYGMPEIEQYPPAKQVIAMGPLQAPGPGYTELRQTWAWDGRSWKVVESRPVVPGSFIRAIYFPEKERFLVLAQGSTFSPKLPLGFRYFSPEKLWEPVKDRNPPPYRRYPMIAYHPRLRKVVMWDGWLGNVWPYYGDTWLFDGTDWTYHSKRSGGWGPVAYDSTRQELLSYYKGLFVFDEKTGWKRKNEPIPRPPGIWWALAHDPARKVTVAHGGSRLDQNKMQVPVGETWEWDGKVWTQRKPRTLPPIRLEHMLCYLPELGGVVLFGGGLAATAATAANDTWLYDGTDWRKLGAGGYAGIDLYWAQGIPPKAAAYDPHRQRILLFHQFQHGGGAPQEMWEFRVETLSAGRNYPRLGEGFPFRVHLPTEAGLPFLFLFSAGTHPGIPLRVNAAGEIEMLPLAPDALLLHSLSGSILTRLDAKGMGSIPFKIPLDKSLLWFPFYAAGLTLDPRVGIRRITNRVDLEVVR